jgi:MFS family permease
VEATRLSGRLKTYLAILLLFSIGNSSDAFLLLRARDLGVSTAAIPVLWTALHVSKLASSYVGGGWSDRAPRARLIVGGWMVYAGTYLGLGFASHAWQAWLLFLVYGLYYGLTEPAEKALVRDLVPDSARGRAFGFYNFIVGISAIPASLLTGWVWEAFGPTAALAVGACVAALSALLLLAWDSARSSRLD